MYVNISCKYIMQIHTVIYYTHLRYGIIGTLFERES